MLRGFVVTSRILELFLRGGHADVFLCSIQDRVDRPISRTAPHRSRRANFPQRALQNRVRLQPYIGC